jgi:hypothetical protein
LIGALPRQWNVLVGEQKIPKDFKSLHFTAVAPISKNTKNLQAQIFGLNIKKLWNRG